MKKIVFIILLGLLLAGCGESKTQVDTNQGGSGIVAGEVTATIEENSPLVFQYNVTNQTEKEITMEFTSSQRIDYSVDKIDGERVFLFSSVTSFLQVLGEETLKQGDTFSSDIDLHDLNLPTGEYQLSVWMTPKEGPAHKATIKFTVE